MKKPNGKDLLNTLIKLLAEQEGVRIRTEVIGGEENEKENKG